MVDKPFDIRVRAHAPLPIRWPSLPGLRLPAPRLGRLTPLVLPAALLAAWSLSVRLGLIPQQILPAPLDVLVALRDMALDGDLASNLLVSLRRVAIGFGAGAGLGLVFAALMATSPRFERMVRPSFLALAQIPVLAWLPFLMMLLDIGEPMKLVLVAKSVFFPVALSALGGLKNVPGGYLEVARISGLTRLQTLRLAIVPAALPSIFSGLRYGLTHAWMALVAVELLASSEGMGYLMVYSRQLFQLDRMVATMVVIGAVGFLLDRLLGLGEARLARRYGAAAR